MKWYVVHAYSGYEKSVKRSLLERIERTEMEQHFGEILVPVEEVIEIKGGQKSISERKFFPGYVLVEMNMTDETWHLVRVLLRLLGSLVGLVINLRLLLRKRSMAFSDKFKKELRSLSRKLCLSLVKVFVLKTDRLWISTGTLRKLITIKVKFESQFRFLGDRRRLN